MNAAQIKATIPPSDRWSLLDDMARQYFGSDRWQKAFAEALDLSPRTLQDWRSGSPPVWALVCMAAMLKARKMTIAGQSITSALSTLSGSDAGA